MKINNKKLENAIIEVAVAFDKEEWNESQKKALNKLAEKLKLTVLDKEKRQYLLLKQELVKVKFLKKQLI